MQMLIYLSDFEELRINQSLKDFSSCDKGALVRSLWVNHGEEDKRVIQLICNICLDYEIYDVVLWGKCLGMLEGDAGSGRYLMGILEYVCSIPEFGRVRSLAGIWNNVLLESLRSITGIDFWLTGIDVEKDRGLFEGILGLLHKCPFLMDLDRSGFIDYFVEVAKVNVVDGLRGLTVFSTDEVIRGHVNTIVGGLDDEKVIPVLDLIHPDKTIDTWTFSICVSAQLITSALFGVIQSRSSYKLVINSRHAVRFARFVVEKREMEGLMRCVLGMGRRDLAGELAGMWYAGEGGLEDWEKEFNGSV
jgi:hypothetical protein